MLDLYCPTITPVGVG